MKHVTQFNVNMDSIHSFCVILLTCHPIQPFAISHYHSVKDKTEIPPNACPDPLV
jgi:hypothetical protein